MGVEAGSMGRLAETPGLWQAGASTAGRQQVRSNQTGGRAAMSLINSLFLDAEADRDRLPVILMSGALGSGKTTFINAMLRDPAMAGTAVAVNEFGAIPLDADLIDHGSEQTVVMANGCLCCNLSGDLEGAVMRLFSRRQDGALPAFERLIIEPSGLADPAPIAEAILRSPLLAKALRLEGIVTTIDALMAATQLERFAEARKQIALADRLVITKADLADDAAVARLQALARQLNPTAPMSLAAGAELAAGLVFPASFLDRAAPHAAVAAVHGPFFAEAVDTAADHAGTFVAVAISCDLPLDWRAFEGWLRSVRLTHAERLLRVKGMLWIAGVSGPIVVHGVHHVLHAPVALEGWGGREPSTRLVLIAERAAAGDIRRSWDLAKPTLIAAA